MTKAGIPRSEATKVYDRKHRAENPEYHKKRIQTWSKNNPEKRIANQRKLTAKRKKVIWEAKDAPCIDCGIKLPPQCMDLDHVRGEKFFCIGTAHAYSVKRILLEIAKCELRCPNCHRLRHHNERLKKANEG